MACRGVELGPKRESRDRQPAEAAEAEAEAIRRLFVNSLAGGEVGNDALCSQLAGRRRGTG